MTAALRLRCCEIKVSIRNLESDPTEKNQNKVKERFKRLIHQFHTPAVQAQTNYIYLEKFITDVTCYFPLLEPPVITQLNSIRVPDRKYKPNVLDRIRTLHPMICSYLAPEDFFKLRTVCKGGLLRHQIEVSERRQFSDFYKRTSSEIVRNQFFTQPSKAGSPSVYIYPGYSHSLLFRPTRDDEHQSLKGDVLFIFLREIHAQNPFLARIQNTIIYDERIRVFRLLTDMDTELSSSLNEIRSLRRKRRRYIRYAHLQKNKNKPARDFSKIDKLYSKIFHLKECKKILVKFMGKFMQKLNDFEAQTRGRSVYLTTSTSAKIKRQFKHLTPLNEELVRITNTQLQESIDADYFDYSSDDFSTDSDSDDYLPNRAYLSSFPKIPAPIAVDSDSE